MYARSSRATRTQTPIIYVRQIVPSYTNKYTNYFSHPKSSRATRTQTPIIYLTRRRPTYTNTDTNSLSHAKTPHVHEHRHQFLEVRRICFTYATFRGSRPDRFHVHAQQTPKRCVGQRGEGAFRLGSCPPQGAAQLPQKDV